MKAEILQRAVKCCPRSPREMAIQPGLSDKELVGLPLPSLPTTEVRSSDNSPQESPSPVYLHWFLPVLRLSLIQWSYRKHFI